MSDPTIAELISEHDAVLRELRELKLSQAGKIETPATQPTFLRQFEPDTDAPNDTPPRKLN